MRRIRHRLAHWLGWNAGTTEVWWQNDELTAGFRCAGCDRLFMVHRVPRYISGA